MGDAWREQYDGPIMTWPDGSRLLRRAAGNRNLALVSGSGSLVANVHLGDCDGYDRYSVLISSVSARGEDLEAVNGMVGGFWLSLLDANLLDASRSQLRWLIRSPPELTRIEHVLMTAQRGTWAPEVELYVLLGELPPLLDFSGD